MAVPMETCTYAGGLNLANNSIETICLQSYMCSLLFVDLSLDKVMNHYLAYRAKRKTIDKTTSFVQVHIM